MSDTPRTDAWQRSIDIGTEGKGKLARLAYIALGGLQLARTLERELAAVTAQRDAFDKERMKFRERAWHAESQIEVKYGLRKEISEALGVTDETGDKALRKGLDAINALKAQRDALLNEHAWQPIETAPKDGTAILLFAPPCMCDGVQCKERLTHGYWLTLEDEYSDPYWVSGDGGFTDDYPPTHWLPMPKAPEITP